MPDSTNHSSDAARVSHAVRRAALIVFAVSLVAFARSFVASMSEAFWLSWPVIVFVGAFILNAIPKPRLNAKSTASRVFAIAVLALFPVAYYGFLVRITGSVWSWRELLVISYFFGLSFEFSLLYAFQFQEWLLDRLQQRAGARLKATLFVGFRTAFYVVLIPYILVIFAVHRPKLLPTPMTTIPSGHVEPIEFLSRDGTTTLRGVFLKPETPRGTVIVCHGVGANHADIEDIHLALFESDFQVLTFDFRGHGRSDGHTITYGLNERLDVLGAYDACLARTDVDPDRVFALGVSMGGASLGMALPEMPQVRAAVLDSAFASMTAMVEHQFRALPEPVRPVLTQVARSFGWIEIGADIESLKTTSHLAKLDLPILIIHGDEDRIVPVEHAHQLHKACRDSQLHIERHCPHIGAVMLNDARYARIVTRHFLSSVAH